MKVKVGATIEGRPLDELQVWDEAAMAAVASWSVTQIVRRTTEDGLDASGEPFADYSTKPIYVAKAGARLSPKGGTPSKTGKSVRYDGGYAEYKKASRKGGIGSAEVDLVASGQLMRSIDAVEVSAEQAIVSVRGQARAYAPFVNEKREFLGHHEGELASLDAVINEQLDRLLGPDGGSK